MYKLTCCSTIDMPLAYVKEENIIFLPFHYFINGKEYNDDMYETMSPSEYYNMVEKSELKTSQVSPEEYEAKWRVLLEDGYDIIHISLSSGISGTYNSANIAKNILNSEYKNRKITVIDSLCCATGYGYLFYQANEKRKAGAEYNELVSFILEQRNHIEHLFYSTDLTQYIKGGRISKAEGMIGSILNICPYLKVDNEGKLKVIGKSRGLKKTRQQIIDLMKQNVINGENYSGEIFISHSNCMEEANEMIALIKETFPQAIFPKYSCAFVGPTIGAHTGCGTVAVYYECKERI